ncbi:MAG: radical SAM protein [Anaerolineales bacterium]|nr:radical SAM protein [Anaerolineales bacterium]
MKLYTTRHPQYQNTEHYPQSPSLALRQHLDARQEELRQYIQDFKASPALNIEENEWLARSYPVLAVLAPVMSTNEDKIEFPGDPMILYSALSHAVDQVVQARQQGLSLHSPYNDLCPQWGYLPSDEYRQSVDDNGIRQYDAPLLNTDQTVFDPRVWNETIKDYFVNVVLKNVRPKVVLISAVSPAHRYAIDIARTVREHLPGCIIVLGGRHADETIKIDPETQELTLQPSSTLSKIADGSIEPVVDFIIAGEGYYALDVLMKAISLAMDIPTKTVNVASVLGVLSDCSPLLGPIPGQALIVAPTPETIHYWPVTGYKINLSTLPSPYKAFAIRARFPIFETEGHISRTAHFMVSNACPYHCMYCSEGVTVVGDFKTLGDSSLDLALERMVEYVQYGAEAFFFDDSLFWGGNVGLMINFCREWIKLREEAAWENTSEITLFGRTVDRRKLLNLEWGAQLTVDFLASRRPEIAMIILNTMRQAGCTYLYIGIESMSETIIQQVHKNVNRKQPWGERVRRALGLARQAGIRVGSSILFGLDGETQETIEETIDKVEELLAEDLIAIASPNILTYHPNTEITHLHQKERELDYHSVNLANRPPYTYFEEAFPAVVSKNLSEEQIWHIHEQTRERWGVKRNFNPMAPTTLPLLEGTLAASSS